MPNEQCSQKQTIEITLWFVSKTVYEQPATILVLNASDCNHVLKAKRNPAKEQTNDSDTFLIVITH